MRKQSVLALALVVGLSGGFALPVRAAGKSNLYDQPPAGCEKTVKMFRLSGFDQCMLSTVCADSITLQLNGKEITIPLCNSEGQYGQPKPNVKGQPKPDEKAQQVEKEPALSNAIPAYASRILELVNEERAKAGLPAVSFDEEVSQAALTRAKEIQISFSHTRPDGRSFSTALTDRGIRYYNAGENIAWGQRSPEEVMQA